MIVSSQKDKFFHLSVQKGNDGGYAKSECAVKTSAPGICPECSWSEFMEDFSPEIVGGGEWEADVRSLVPAKALEGETLKRGIVTASEVSWPVGSGAGCSSGIQDMQRRVSWFRTECSCSTCECGLECCLEVGTRGAFNRPLRGAQTARNQYCQISDITKKS